VFGEPISHVRLIGSATFSKNKLAKTEGGLLDGKTATGNPKLQLRMGSEWDVNALKGLTLNSTVSYVSDQFTNNENTRRIPNYTLVDFGARYSFKAYAKPITIRADLNNAFAKDYYGSATNGLILGYPRTLLISTSVDF
jgi:iron complex outermembrane recepter protein